MHYLFINDPGDGRVQALPQDPRHQAPHQICPLYPTQCSPAIPILIRPQLYPDPDQVERMCQEASSRPRQQASCQFPVNGRVGLPEVSVDGEIDSGIGSVT